MQLKSILVSWLAVLALPVHAHFATSGWDIGGGKRILDSLNPWFLRDGRIVRYCLDADPESFQLELRQLRELVHNALKYWDMQFSLAHNPGYNFQPPPGAQTQVHGPYRFEVETHLFQEVSCYERNTQERREDLDLSIQFGRLTDSQLKHFDHRPPLDYAALTFRESYDSEALRGRGFIYIAPKDGVYAAKSASVLKQKSTGQARVLTKQVLLGPKQAWGVQDKRRLQMTLIHELGHVFGLGHTGPRGSLMSADFVDKIVSMPVDTVERLSRRAHLGFFYPISGLLKTSCSTASNPPGSIPMMRLLLKEQVEGIEELLAAESVCWQVHHVLDGQARTKSIDVLLQGLTHNSVVGRMELRIVFEADQKKWIRFKDSIQLWVEHTKDQSTWLPGIAENFRGYLPGMQKASVRLEGKLSLKRTTAGRPSLQQTVWVTLDTDQVEIGTVLSEGIYVPDLLPGSSGWNLDWQSCDQRFPCPR